MDITDILDGKFWASILAALIAFACVKYAGLSVQEALTVISPILGYLGIQGLASIGKEAEFVRQAGRGLANKKDD